MPAGSVKGTVIDSNIFKSGSTWEIRATPHNGGGRVKVIAVRHVKELKGAVIRAIIRIGYAKRYVAGHLRRLLSKVEEGQA